MAILVLGDSIMAGVWLVEPDRDSIIARLADRLSLAGRPVEFAILAEGGAQLDDPAGGSNVVATQVAAAQATGEHYEACITLAGTNDLVNHDMAGLEASKWAAIAADVALQGMGIPVRLWMSVLAIGKGSSHPDGWMPDLLSRWRAFTEWQRAQWEPLGQYLDMAGVLHEDGSGEVPAGYSFLLLDGLHPSRYGALDIAEAIPLERLP